MHKKNILVRDIKIDNIMATGYMCQSLSGFIDIFQRELMKNNSNYCLGVYFESLKQFYLENNKNFLSFQNKVAISPDLCLRITDLNSSIEGDISDEILVHDRYKAPENASECYYSRASEIWAFGNLCFEIYQNEKEKTDD